MSVITKKTNHANRGIKLEAMIENRCKKYIKEGVAYIYKLPTDFTVIRRGAHIVSAFPKKKSTIDFMGSYGNDGKAIAIEAKSTTNKTSFPFSNIADHQLNFFKGWCKASKGYYIVWFRALGEMYLVDAMRMQKAIDTLDRKSAPHSWFVENGIRIDDDLDFIKLI